MRAIKILNTPQGLESYDSSPDMLVSVVWLEKDEGFVMFNCWLCVAAYKQFKTCSGKYGCSLSVSEHP